MAELADLGREAVGIRGNVDVTFDPERATYVITLKRRPLGMCELNASMKMFTELPGQMRTPVHLEVVYCLNNLDGCLTREERRNAGRGVHREN